MIVIFDYIFKKYICKIGCALHKKTHVLRAPCTFKALGGFCALVRFKALGGLCALVRLMPFTTMVYSLYASLWTGLFSPF